LENELSRAFATFTETPFIYANIHRGVHRALLQNLPVGVFYKVIEDTVYVVSVLHLARNPRVWRKR